MTKTFVDSGVLIAAAHGRDPVSQAAFDILDDPERQFASSILVRLETIPKSTYFGRDSELGFYEDFFERVSEWAPFDSALAELALVVACNAGLSAIDSLLVAAAHQTGCDEFITTEKPATALHRSTLVKIRTIAP